MTRRRPRELASDPSPGAPTQKSLEMYAYFARPRQNAEGEGPARNYLVCESFEASQRILEAARTKKDERVLIEVQSNPDCIATDTVYHRSCYAKYTLCTTLAYRYAADMQSTALHDQAFEAVAGMIESEVLKVGGIKAMSIEDLREKFIAKMEELGKPGSTYKAELLKYPIQQRFKELVRFPCSSVTEPECVVAAGVCEEDFLKVISRMVGEARVQEKQGGEDTDALVEVVTDSATPDIEIFHAAMNLHHAVRSVDPVLSSTPRASELNSAAAEMCVPLFLHNLLAWIIGGPDLETVDTTGLVQVSPKVYGVVTSIGQDIVYAANHGRVIPPKHLALATTTRHLTRSQQLATVLNRFGHAVSDSKASEIEISLVMETQQCDVTLPSNISSSGRVFFCTDNNNRNEETLDGKGTMHSTDTIVLQNTTHERTTSTAAVTASERRSSSGRRPRSLAPSYPVELPYVSVSRSNLQPPLAPNLDGMQSNTAVLDAGESLDIAWLLLRASEEISRFGCNTIESTTPGWSGFKAATGHSNRPVPTRVGYLPLIPEPPTNTAAVCEVIQRAIHLARSLGQEHCILTGDQAVCAKAVDIRWHKKEEYPELVLRMGAFPAT